MEWSSSSDAESKRKLMQIGFAALLARKQVVQKQYSYEDRTDGGFVFEPVLRNNQAEMADEEYMRKKYYSQVVYEGTMDGSMDTSIQEPDPNKRAARRLWAGRKGTGWNGTGKGGYMASLQPGVPETEGTGLGSAKVESDLLMQVYLEKQSNKMHILKAKSQIATQDLFKQVAKHAAASTGVADLSAQQYIPPPKDQGVSLQGFRQYVSPGYLPGKRDSSPAQKREWAVKAIRKLESINWDSVKADPQSSLYTSYGFMQGRYANKLLKTNPTAFLQPEDRRRLVANKHPHANPRTGKSYNQPEGGDREVGMDVGSLYEDQTTDPGTFSDREDTEHFGNQLGPRSGRDGGRAPDDRNFTGDGGALSINNMEIADAKLLRTTFKKENINQLFPKSWDEYKKRQNRERNTYNMAAGQLLNQDLDVPQVNVQNRAEAERFIRWMQKELNDEQAKLNEIIPQYDDWGYLDWKDKSVSPTMGTPFMKDYAGTSGKSSGYSETHKFIGGYTPAAIGTFGKTFKGLGGDTGYKAEILGTFLGDFGLLNDEANYLMSTRFGKVKNPETDAQEWKWINRRKELRGVDLYLPQDGGLLKVHVSAKVVPATANSRAYVKLEIPYKSKYNDYKGGITFIPDVPYQLQDMELMEMKGEENLENYNAVTQEFWKAGAQAQYMGASMLTQSGYSTRMFMGDTSPVNSVGLYTSTISVGDFADQLKTLVDIGAEYWWSERSGFDRYFDLEEMEGGAFKKWALKWAAESKRLEDKLNHDIEMKWQLWLNQYAGGGDTAPAPRIANTWEGPVKIGPFVHSTKYLGQAQSISRRPHGYYKQEDPLG